MFEAGRRQRAALHRSYKPQQIVAADEFNLLAIREGPRVTREFPHADDLHARRLMMKHEAGHFPYDARAHAVRAPLLALHEDLLAWPHQHEINPSVGSSLADDIHNVSESPVGLTDEPLEFSPAQRPQTVEVSLRVQQPAARVRPPRSDQAGQTTSGRQRKGELQGPPRREQQRKRTRSRTVLGDCCVMQGNPRREDGKP
nr:hypothetical protein [Burkholderia pseudomallei]